MQCYAGPIHAQSPYPDAPVTLDGLTFADDMILFRPKEALLNREAGEDVYLVGADKLVHWTAEGDQCGQVTVPFGFITNLTSVPPLFRGLVSRAGPWLEAAVVHDYLYIAWQDIPGGTPRAEDRKFADDIMFFAMEAAEVSAWRKWSIYAAVRLLGGFTYGKRNDCNYGDQTDPRLLYLKDVPKVV